MNLSRRQLMAALLAPASSPRPNIVLLLANGLSASSLGCYGNKELRTPSLDRLARMSTRFANHFVCSTEGTPFFTGRVKPAAGAGLAEHLAQAGYSCGYFGQWHAGSAASYRATYIFRGISRYQDPLMERDGQPVEEEGYLAAHITRHAFEFLEQQDAGRPFFLTVAHQNPRPPLDGHPLKYGGRFPDSWAANRRKYAASLAALDDQMGSLLGKLRERKLDGNTVVVFTSICGSLFGNDGQWDAGPASFADESIRVPLIWSWPGKVPVESVRPELVSSYDLLPTLAELLGLKTPAADELCGRSYLRPVTGKTYATGEHWDDPVFCRIGDAAMARDTRYKLVLRNNGTGPCEFYDLRLDSQEAANQYDSGVYTAQREKLKLALDAWRKRFA
jgi:arylsulfatase A-like enzyme